MSYLKVQSAVVLSVICTLMAFSALAYDYSWIEGCWESPSIAIEGRWIPLGTRYPVIELQGGLGEISLSAEEPKSLSYSISPIDEGSFALYDNENGKYDGRFFRGNGRLCQIGTTTSQSGEPEDLELCYQRCEGVPDDEK